MVGACDANAWLQAVGTIDNDATTLQLRHLAGPDTELSQRIWASNNAGVTLLWSVDGSELLFGTSPDLWVIDAVNGTVIGQPTTGELHVLGRLSDGVQLVAEEDATGTNFWTAGPDAAPADTAKGEPLLRTGQIRYPAAEVDLSLDGSRIAVVTSDDGQSFRTHIITTAGDVLALDGRGSLSPDGEFALVTTAPDGDLATTWRLYHLADVRADGGVPWEGIPAPPRTWSWCSTPTRPTGCWPSPRPKRHASTAPIGSACGNSHGTECPADDPDWLSRRCLPFGAR